MNILFLCDMHPSRPWVRDRLPGLQKASKAYEGKIYIRDVYEIFGNEVSDYLREHVGRDQRLTQPNIRLAEKNFLMEINRYNVDTIVFATADNYREFLTLDFIMVLKSKGYKLVGFLGDDEFNHPQYRYLAAIFDNFVVYVEKYKKFYEDITENQGFLLLNSCHLPKIDKILNEPKTKYDTVMIGGPIPARVNVLRKLKKEGFSIAVYGPKSWQHFSDFAEDYKGFVNSEEFDIRLSEGKIILSMLEDHISGKMHMNTKIWECARAGTFTIASHYEPLFSNYGFKEGTDIVTYHAEADLITKFKYYHKKNEEREIIRKNFIRKVNSELDYKILYLQFFVQLKTELKKSHVSNYMSAHKTMNSENLNLEGVFYNIISSGRPVKQYFPFINPLSINHFKKNRKNKLLSYMHFFLRRRKYFHVNLYIELSDDYNLISQINRIIHTYKYGYIKPFYQKNIKPLKKRILGV
jgi:spore maturation protein CgeB